MVRGLLQKIEIVISNITYNSPLTKSHQFSNKRITQHNSNESIYPIA